MAHLQHYALRRPTTFFGSGCFWAYNRSVLERTDIFLTLLRGKTYIRAGAHVSSWSFFRGVSLLFPKQTNEFKRNINHMKTLGNINENQYHKICLSGTRVSPWSFSGSVSLLFATQTKEFISQIRHMKILSNIKENQYYETLLSGDSRQLLEIHWGCEPALFHTNKLI